MSRVLFIALLIPLSALAKPWNGIVPGDSGALDVVGKFGEPSKRLKSKGLEVLVYTRETAIKGTVQAQFKVDAQTQVVERIDVYPEPILDAAAIEKSYGGECAPKAPKEPCYYRKEAEAKDGGAGGKRPYFLYLKLGLAIFFKDDGKTVQSFAFLPEPKE